MRSAAQRALDKVEAAETVARAGDDVANVSRRLRHANPSNTLSIYTHEVNETRTLAETKERLDAPVPSEYQRLTRRDVSRILRSAGRPYLPRCVSTVRLPSSSSERSSSFISSYGPRSILRALCQAAQERPAPYPAALVRAWGQGVLGSFLGCAPTGSLSSPRLATAPTWSAWTGRPIRTLTFAYRTARRCGCATS
jgi:hypothetical protein